MSIDFSATQPGNTASAGRPVDIQALQETFAAVLRSYGTEKGGSPTTTLLEILRPDPAGSASGEDRNQQRREAQQRADRNDFTQIDRQQLDRAEIRSRDMNTDYRNRLDRQEALRNDYQERTERSELRQLPALQTTSAARPPDITRPNEPLPNMNPLQPQQSHVAAVQVSEVAGANNQSASATIAAPNSPASAASANLLMPVNVNTPAAMPTAPQPAAPQAFTVFTPSGRFGQPQGKSEEDEEEKEERAEGKPEKKKQPFAALEAIRAETTRPIQRNVPQQPRGPADRSEHRQTGDDPRERLNLRERPNPHERPGAAEPKQTQTAKTLDELLNTPSQNIVTQETVTQATVTQETLVQRKGESNTPNPAQYLHRIAAACEAAGQFAPIRIKLNLDHLGTLTLRFYHKADRLALRFETPTRESAQFLRDNLEEFRIILSKRSVKMMDVEIVWEE